MHTVTFHIQGMTCGNCVKKVSEMISGITGVVSVKVSLENQSVEILSEEKVQLHVVRDAFKDLPKYTITEANEVVKESSLTTYKPLIIVLTLILLVCLAYQYGLPEFQMPLFMNHLMAGFFIGFSLFKILDLEAFAQSFSGYDPVAKHWKYYGYVYPFIELALGLLYVANAQLVYANIVTMVILALTTLGVYQRLQVKSPLKCACLGANFNLPLSYVTIVENVLMIVMAGYSLRH